MIRWYCSKASRSPPWARAQSSSFWFVGWGEAYDGGWGRKLCCCVVIAANICSMRSSIFFMRRPNSPAEMYFSFSFCPGSRGSCSGFTAPAGCSAVSGAAPCSGSWPAGSSDTMGSLLVGGLERLEMQRRLHAGDVLERPQDLGFADPVVAQVAHRGQGHPLGQMRV